jgi:hypothetical protein
MSQWNNLKEGIFSSGTSFILFKETDNPYLLEIESVSSSKYTLEKNDAIIIKELRKFRDSFLSDKAQEDRFFSDKKQYQVTLKDLHNNLTGNLNYRKFHDLICKIMKIRKYNATGQLELTVSDGTKFKKDTTKNFNSLYFGSEVKVVIINPHIISYIERNSSNIAVGKWCKVRNVIASVLHIPHEDTELDFEIKCGDNSSIVALPDYFFHVKQLESAFKKRNKKNMKRLCENENDIMISKKPKQEFLTVVKFPKAPINSIKEIEEWSHIPYKFRCYGKLVSFYFPDQSNNKEMLFQIKIQDNENNTLIAYVQGSEAEYFFSCSKKSNWRNNIDSLKQRLQKAVESESLMDLCLIAYKYKGSKQTEYSKRYHVFGTRLIIEQLHVAGSERTPGAAFR